MSAVERGMKMQHVPVVGRALAEKANGNDWNTLERLGYVATMRDGRKVVKLPVRDEYFRLVNRRGMRAPEDAPERVIDGKRVKLLEVGDE